VLRGKTGERRVRIIAFVKLLQQWLNIHPLKHLSSYPIWISEATNYKNNPLGLRGAEKIIEEALPKPGLTNKLARLYILRHSRATHLEPIRCLASARTPWEQKIASVQFLFSVRFAA